jgi:DNA-binding GntR family transcriptional regulator
MRGSVRRGVLEHDRAVCYRDGYVMHQLLMHQYRVRYVRTIGVETAIVTSQDDVGGIVLVERPSTPTISGMSGMASAEDHVPDPLAGIAVAQRQLDGQIYDALKHKILARELAPGTPLPIRALAQRLGVSVTPVRDALRRLQADGLVQIRSRGETTVTALTPGDIDEIFDLRIALEGHAARRGVLRVADEELARLERLLDDSTRTVRGDVYLDYPTYMGYEREFHRALVAAAGNGRLSAAYEALGAHVQITRVYYTRERRPRETHAEHRAILAAYRRRDVAAAQAALERHVENTRRHILRLLNEATESG